MSTTTSNSIEQTISNGRKTALASFLIGSIILLVYYFSNYNSMIYFALFFCMAALLINGFFFIQLMLEYFKKNAFQNKILKTLGLMLLNIPVGILYFEIGFFIYSSVTPQ